MRCEMFVRLGSGDAPLGGVLEEACLVKELDIIDTFDELDCGIGPFIRSIEELNVAPCEGAIDLLVVASSVYLADTSFSRSTYSSDGWTRRFLLHIPVSEPDVWSGHVGLLAGMLKFLTGDYWEFRFRARPEKYTKLAKAPKELDLTEFDCVSLFSGGLDSLVGAIDLLSCGQKPLLISHYWDGEASSAQNALHEALQGKFGDVAFKVVRGRIGMTQTGLDGAGSENTQRARSFLFYSMAALAADALQTTDRVFIPENGLIALNVPMDRVRLGSLSTRTAHPHFIHSMDQLTTAIGVTATFSNPYRFNTKGEMVAECADLAFLTKIASKSMSCSSPAKVRWQGATPQHCGHCVPCMIRRASLKAGLPQDDETAYFLDDLTSNVLDSKKAEGKDIRSFLYASQIISKSPEKARFIVRKPGPLPIAEVEGYADVYRRGMAEVTAMLAGVRSRHE